MQLKDLQAYFYHALQTRELDPELLDAIEHSDELSQTDRLHIYRDSVFGSRYDLLADTFKAVKFYLKEQFEVLAFDCIKRMPSISENLDEYAKHFLAYLEHAETEFPFLYELAQFEWNYYSIFFTQDILLINQDAFSTAVEQSPEKIIFYTPKSSYLVESRFPLLKLWEVAYGFSKDEPSLDESCVCMAVRLGDDVYFTGLDENDLLFLKGVRSGFTMDDLCHELGDTIMDVLPKAIENHWVDRFSLGE